MNIRFFSKLSIVTILLNTLWIPTIRAQSVLHASGNKIVDSLNVPVILRGVNLGGWLVTEDWMCGILDSSDPEGRSARQTLEGIYTETQVNQLMNTWENNWITAADIDTIRSLGFNFMRVPFGWRNLQYQNEQWCRDTSGKIDFSRFDWIVNQAAAHHMYVIFDFHVWLNQNLDYSGISNVDSVILNACTIWKAVAGHFKNNPTVAAYDLLNEPTGSTHDTVMHIIYDTVRSVDPTHMIALEGVNFDTARWHNVLYEDHWYGLTAPNLTSNIAYFDSAYLPVLHKADSLKAPFYVGETQSPNDSSLAWSLNEYCLYQTNWSPWTYKTINQWGWGLLSFYPNHTAVNILTAPFDTILTKWSQVSNAGNCYELQDIKTIWSNGAKDNCSMSGIPTVELQKSPLTVFPNPAQNSITLLFNDALNNSATIGITDLTGRLVSLIPAATGTGVNNEVTLNVSGLAAGVYFVRVSSGQLVYNAKFIKE